MLPFGGLLRLWKVDPGDDEHRQHKGEQVYQQNAFYFEVTVQEGYQDWREQVRQGPHHLAESVGAVTRIVRHQQGAENRLRQHPQIKLPHREMSGQKADDEQQSRDRLHRVGKNDDLAPLPAIRHNSGQTAANHSGQGSKKGDHQQRNRFSCLVEDPQRQHLGKNKNIKCGRSGVFHRVTPLEAKA